MKILCLGDSNTYGYDPRSVLEDSYAAPWPALLEEMLNRKGEVHHTVINLGMNGRELPSSDLQMQWIDLQIRRELPADLLILLLGTNDLINTAWQPEELVKQRLSRFLPHLRTIFPALPILLLVPMPFNELGTWPTCSVYPPEIPAIYKAAGTRYDCTVADCSQWNLPLTFDGVHLTEEGHRLFASLCLKEIQSML